MPKAVVLSSLSRFLAADLSAEELERSLPDAWELDQEGDPGLRRLVLRIMADLGQRTRGDLTDDELRIRLAPLAKWASFRIVFEDATVDVVPEVVTTQSSGVGREREAALA